MSNSLKLIANAAVLYGFLVEHHKVAADVLYTNSGSTLHVVNQTEGGVVEPGRSCNCNLTAEAIAWRPGDSGHLYGVVNSNGETARMVKISVQSGHYELFPFFSDSALGFEKAFADGIAVSSLNPSVAVVTGFDAETTSPTYANYFAWTIDLASGAILSPGVPITANVSAITFTLDGTRLYGADDSGRLVTLDPNTGMSTIVGDPGLSDFIEGLAFRPSDGELFAIDGYTSDRLVILNPLSGSLVATVGSLHRGGPHGLAFLIPEPAAAVMLATAATALLAARRR